MSQGNKNVGLYADAQEALRVVNDYYRTWTRQLSERSFELSLGVIGVNWATFGDLNKVLMNSWSKASLAIVIIGFGITIVGTWRIGELLRKQVDYAEENPGRWEEEFQANQGKSSPWPSTAEIDNTARRLRLVKTFAPVLGGACFVFALFFP